MGMRIGINTSTWLQLRMDSGGCAPSLNALISTRVRARVRGRGRGGNLVAPRVSTLITLDAVNNAAVQTAKGDPPPALT